ncbi:MAG: hypothetical protein ACFB20_05150 [Opitutales bacterium]
MTPKEIFDEALKLEDAERLELVRGLLGTLESEGDRIAVERELELATGAVSAISIEDAKQRFAGSSSH